MENIVIGIWMYKEGERNTLHLFSRGIFGLCFKLKFECACMHRKEAVWRERQKNLE